MVPAPEVGSLVVLKGLKSTPELNGAEAEVIPPQAGQSPERVAVRLLCGSGSGRVLAVKPENFTELEVSDRDEFTGCLPAIDSSDEEEEDEEVDQEEQKAAATAATNSAGEPARPTAQAHGWCYGCFKRFPRSALQRCSKCSTALFCSRGCQRSCHPFHKRSCAPPEPEVVSRMSGPAVLQKLKSDFGGVGPSPNSALLLARMRELLVEYYAASKRNRRGCRLRMDPNEVGMEIHTMARIFAPEEHCMLYYSQFWAAPGMPEFLLNTPLSQAAVAQGDEDGDSSTLKYQGRDLRGRSAEESEDMAGYQFGFFHFTFMVNSICKEGSSMGSKFSSVNAGCSPLRRDLPAFEAAARRTGLLYVSSVEKCGDALAVGPGCLLVLCASEPAMRKEFLEAGLARAILNDLRTGASKRKAKELLASIPLSDFHELSVEQAAFLAADFVEALADNDLGDEEEEGSEEVVKKVLLALFTRQTLEGKVPTKNARAIMEKVLDLGLRTDVMTRAFFHFALEQQATRCWDPMAVLEDWEKCRDAGFSHSRKRPAGDRELHATYKKHMAAVMSSSERREWNFIFK
mmetsp:Transcript_35623/g.83321  ORF Transcript_35623/g.83321 Transcript_35623/m.83321 type:complete len:573 (+) Transcript_35623:73-1791(+)